MKKFSIVVPIYHNELNIPYTIPELKKVSTDLEKEYEVEFIFVNDGSKDGSLRLLIVEAQKDKRIKVVNLSRNFGSMAAIQAGIAEASGDCVGIITADLQDPPELFKKMIEKWEYGKKVVMAVRKDREDSLLQKIFAGSFYYLMSRYALPGYPSGGFDFVLIDKKVARDITEMTEKNTNIMNLIYWLGYEKEYIRYVRRERKHGKSQWTFSKKIKLFLDSFIAFSYAPIRLISFVGLITAIASFAYGTYVIANHLLGRIPIQGYTAIMSVVTFLLGLIMIMLGIIGEYLWRILDEARGRPPYVVDFIYKFGDEGDNKNEKYF